MHIRSIFVRYDDLMMNLDAAKDISTYFTSDKSFDQLYPAETRQLADKHWTPLEVAKKAAAFLASEGQPNILDVGSGVGKFCLAGAHYYPSANYFGVEQREKLVVQANQAKQELGLQNVQFLHANFLDISLDTYDHFYFFNSFYENVFGTQKIDREIEYSKALYEKYMFTFYRKLEQKPAGTKLVAFHIADDRWPRNYHVVGSAMGEMLNFLIKL